MLKELKVDYLINKSSAVVIVGDDTRIYPAGTPEFEQVKEFVRNKDDIGLVKLVRKVRDFIAQIPAYIGFTVKEDVVLINDEPLPTCLGKRLRAFADSGAPYEYLLKFWDNLKKNPSKNSVDNLYQFLENVHCPITEDGRVMAYKVVQSDGWDKYTGKTFYHEIGKEIRVPRNSVDDDNSVECSFGAHCGGLSYIHWYGSESDGDRIFQVLIWPEDFVATPRDHSFTKARVCAYTPAKEVSWDEVEPTKEVY